MTTQFLRFAFVGAFGFLVDASVLGLGLHFGLDPYSARALSFFCAVTFTWVANRHLTFRAEAKPAKTLAGEWSRFVAVNAVGGIANYGVYSLLVGFGPWPLSQPFMALALGSLSGLGLNFWGSRRLVFGGS